MAAFRRNSDAAGLVLTLRTMQMRGRLSDKLKAFLFVALVPSSDDYDALPLPPQISGLYFAIRPSRLALGGP